MIKIKSKEIENKPPQKAKLSGTPRIFDSCGLERVSKIKGEKTVGFFLF